MPLKYVTWKGYDYKEQSSTVAELLAIAKVNPFHPVPYPALRSMLEQEYRPDGISITNVIGASGKGCLRCAVLERYVDYTESLSAMHKRWKGSMYHYVLETFGYDDEATAEVRFWADLPGGLGEIHGKPDLLYMNKVLDLKTTQSVPRWDKVWDDHNLQLQLYRWLVNHATRWDHDDQTVDDLGSLADVVSTEFDGLGIWYVDDEGWKPLEVRRSYQVETTSKSAKSATKTVKGPDVWSDAAVEEFLVPAYVRLKEALAEFELTGRLPAFAPGIDPTPQGFWAHRYRATADLCIRNHYEGNRPLTHLIPVKEAA